MDTDVFDRDQQSIPADLIMPVEQIATDDPQDGPEEGIALCLSGGGFRAMLFHLGTLWRLNQLGYLPRLRRVSSVSGGSIAAGVLGLQWSQLVFVDGVASNFDERVAAPLHGLAGARVDLPAALRGVFGRGTINDAVAQAYRSHLFGTATLQDLPDDDAGPRFVINASNLQSGALWRFSKPYSWDWRVGKIEHPRTQLAVAVAASSAFPPFLSPAILEFEPAGFVPGSGHNLQYEPYTTRVQLSDGGVYDNLGLETAWKRYRTILVSDGGGRLEAEKRPKRDWLRHSLRVMGVIDNQVRSLRKRQVLASFQLPETNPLHRSGAYWGIRSDIADYPAAGRLPCPPEQTLLLATTPTRLSRLSATHQQRLVNWGYAICDAAMRAYLDPTLAPPVEFPYPAAGVG